MVVSGQRKYFYLAIDGSMEMFIPVEENNVHFIIMETKQLVGLGPLSLSLDDL